MRSFARGEIEGLEGNLISILIILKILLRNYKTEKRIILEMKMNMVSSAPTCILHFNYRLYVSEWLCASKGGIPYKNSKQRTPRLHISTPESCSLLSTANEMQK